MPFSFDIATEDVRISGIEVTVDSNTKKAEKIERIQITEDSSENINYDSDDGRPEYYNSF
jgi:calcineurin-like phosphoesterase